MLKALANRLDGLEARLPQMIHDHLDPGDFWMTFAGEADAIREAAGNHAVEVSERIRSMLAAHGRYLIDAELEDA